jgi:hypothetical protein
MFYKKYKSLIMKNLKYIFILFLAYACNKKDGNLIKESEFTYDDSKLTVEQVIANFNATADGGIFTMGQGGLSGIYGGEKYGLGDKQTHILIADRKFEPSKVPEMLGNYYVPDYLTQTQEEIDNIYAYFNNLYSTQSRVTFKLYDTNNKFVVGFNLRNPKLLNASIDNRNLRGAPVGTRANLTWDADPENKLGLAIRISGDGGLRYINVPDNGSYDLTDIGREVGGNDRVSISISRGSLVIGKGSDGRDYKISNTIGATESIVY